MYLYYLSPFGKAYTYPAVHLLRYQIPAASRFVPSHPVHLHTKSWNTPLHFQSRLFKHTTNLSLHMTRFHLLHIACSDIGGTLNFINLTFRGPCIVVYSYKPKRCTIFFKFILVQNSKCFGQVHCPSSGV
jgi:hypothetical protein